MFFWDTVYLATIAN